MKLTPVSSANAPGGECFEGLSVATTLRAPTLELSIDAFVFNDAVPASKVMC